MWIIRDVETKYKGRGENTSKRKGGRAEKRKGEQDAIRLVASVSVYRVLH